MVTNDNEPPIPSVMRRGVFVYISGPITARGIWSVENHIAEALQVYVNLLKLGIPCFCPHLSAMFPSCHAEITYDQWIDYDFAVIDRCTHLLMLGSWEGSRGAKLEREYALSKGIPVFESIPDLLKVLP